ncbi:MAG: ABC transporter substrate-binding protein [Chloroflexota bacterium]
MNKRSTYRLLVTLTLAALLLAACGGAGGEEAAPTEPPVSNPPVVVDLPTGAPPPPPGGMTLSKDILLDPANASDADSLAVIGYIYEGLFKVQGAEVTPILAESYEVSDDGLDYRITLRPNLTFHDGSPVNADAVIANFNRWFDPEDPARGSGDFAVWADLFLGFKGETKEGGAPKSIFDGAEKEDDLTLLIHLTTPDPQFIVKLNNPAFSIVSPAALKAEGFGTSTGKASGTGPYMLDSWSDTGLTLKPFASYWGAVATELMEFTFK